MFTLTLELELGTNGGGRCDKNERFLIPRCRTGYTYFLYQTMFAMNVVNGKFISSKKIYKFVIVKSLKKVLM